MEVESSRSNAFQNVCKTLLVTYIGGEGPDSEHEEAEDERPEAVFIHRLYTTEIVHPDQERAGRSQSCTQRVKIVCDGSVQRHTEAGVRTQPHQHHHLKPQQLSSTNSMQ